MELRQLRCLVAIADAGTFTDAAIELGISQAAVSRTLAGLESELGVRLLRRTSRAVAPTATGNRVLTHARRLLAEADALVADATSGHTRLRVGHAWSALGRHTQGFVRRWADGHPDVELHLVRTNSPTAGLAEGVCDAAIIRVGATAPDGVLGADIADGTASGASSSAGPAGVGAVGLDDGGRLDERRFASVLVGIERRFCAIAADDPWARRRFIRLAEFAERTVLIDRRTGTTTLELWPASARPTIEYTADIDDWLTSIGTGGRVGVTAESTLSQYPRPGIVYRPVRDAPPVAVRLAWWRDDPHPAVPAAIELLTALYRT